jgi:3-deoxy-D-manno-octulosonic-acid transferase
VTKPPPLPYRVATAAVPRFAALLSSRARDVLKARRDSFGALVTWAKTHRERSRPLVVLHATSAGELRQAEPVLRRLRRRQPGWQLIATHFSPSAVPVARQLEVDASGYFPWDTSAEVAAFLDALAPSALVWCKHDIWPVAAMAASARGVRLGLIAATVRPGSSRLGWLARRLLGPSYMALEAVGAVSEEDAAALSRLGVQSHLVEVTGDPRYDAVLERLEGQPLAPGQAGTLVAGSTWAADEDVLLTALRQVLEQQADARLLIVPHRPSLSGWHRIAQRAAALGLPTPVLPGDASPGDVLLVSQEVGSLAVTYAQGGITYVGGGYRSGGLHSVLEPAAVGRPVLVGPMGRDNRDARLLNQAEALEYLPRRRGAAVLEAWWVNWARDAAWRLRAGQAARHVVEGGRGAADRSAALIERLVLG